ncbi:conserved hypothetical protein [Ricinus communis]|uniref:Uncharacterized protein n=1 Tax=Ricinus communis TaxID=3988 RepID=B9SXG1_RICCO|nr:conserved hypothetical protein [Ricinus communis]
MSLLRLAAALERKNGIHPKPVSDKGWLELVRGNDIRIGDYVSLLQGGHGDIAELKIEVKRRLFWDYLLGWRNTSSESHGFEKFRNSFWFILEKLCNSNLGLFSRNELKRTL